MKECGRIRKPLSKGWTSLVNGELADLTTGTISLEQGESYTLNTEDREYSLVLVKGECEVRIHHGESGVLGPRTDPFGHPPSAVFLTREETVTIVARQDSLIGAGSAPAAKKMRSSIITPEQTRSVERGTDNWSRTIRFVCWSDNTEGNMLMTGETVTPSGNWSTIPPHRHQYDIPGEEVAYEEVYFLQFSHPHGFGLSYQFDEETGMDQAFSLKANDSLYIGRGYHPMVCAPGGDLYHITFISGPQRTSKASVHKDFEFLLNERNMQNPFKNQ